MPAFLFALVHDFLATAILRLTVARVAHAGRESIALSGQYHRQFVELALKAVEGTVQIGKKLIVLHIDLIGVHVNDGAAINDFDIPCHV